MNKFGSKIDRSNLFYRLAILLRRWRQVLDNEFQSVGLTDATWRPLFHLHLLGDGVRQKDLAASIGIEGPSLVRLIDTLVAKGLVQRREDSNDRRARKLLLTEEGQRVVVSILQIVAKLDSELLAPFSDSEIARVGNIVLSLEERVNEARRRLKL